MPWLDTSDLLTDPDFADTFTLVRTSQTVSSGGIASDATPTTYTCIGVIEPDKGRALQRLDAGSRLTDAIKIYTQTRLTTGAGATEADQVQWNGGTYTVVNVRDWSRFGAGYLEVVADLTDLNPPTDYSTTVSS